MQSQYESSRNTLPHEFKSNPRGAAHACSGNSFRGGVSSRIARRPKGQSTVEYVLIIAIIVLVILIAGPLVSSAIRNQFNLVAGAIGSGTTGENFYEPEDIPDPQNGTAFAVYSEDDHSLMFYKRRGVPDVGDIFNYRKVTAVYVGFEDQIYYFHNANLKYPTGAWYERHSDIKTVSVIDSGIQPTHMDGWFSFLTNCSEFNGLDKIDYSKCVSLSYLFYACTSLIEFKLENIALPSCGLFGGMFESCTGLKTVDLSGWRFNEHGDIRLWFLFAQCTSLTSVDLSGWDTSRASNFSHAFYECTSLETLDISSFSSCTSGAILDNMFTTCVKLRSIAVGSGWLWANMVFPTPSSSRIPGADGKWYAASDSTGYAPVDIPSSKADTYVASRNYLP